MTENQKSAPKKKKAKKKPDPAKQVPLEETTGTEPQKADAKTPKKETKKAAPETAKTPEPAKDGKDQATIAPLSGCKVYGQPDVHHKKCRLCKDLEQCLAIELLSKKKKKSRQKKEPRGTSFSGFLKGSKKATFAAHIAKQPCHMREIKKAPWNQKELTWYDTFNELRRNTTEEGEPLPLAAKNKEGIMCILEKNLNKDQKEKMKEEVKEFPY